MELKIPAHQVKFFEPGLASSIWSKGSLCSEWTPAAWKSWWRMIRGEEFVRNNQFMVWSIEELLWSYLNVLWWWFPGQIPYWQILHLNCEEWLRGHFKVCQIPVPPTLSLENFAKADYRLEEDMVRSYFRLQNNTILLKHYEKFME